VGWVCWILCSRVALACVWVIGMTWMSLVMLMRMKCVFSPPMLAADVHFHPQHAVDAVVFFAEVVMVRQCGCACVVRAGSCVAVHNGTGDDQLPLPVLSRVCLSTLHPFYTSFRTFLTSTYMTPMHNCRPTCNLRRIPTHHTPWPSPLPTKRNGQQTSVEAASAAHWTQY